MREIKKSVEVVDRLESDDGKVGYDVGKSHSFTREEAEEKIRNYEKTAGAVLFKRLLDRGVLRQIKHYLADTETLTEEQRAEKDCEGVCDGIVDNYCGNYFFYIYEPKTEEDIRDLLTYGRIDDEDIYFPKTEDGLGLFTCKENELAVGRRYLFCEHNDGYKHMYRLDLLRERLNGWIDYLERF